MQNYPANPNSGTMATTVCCSEQEAWGYLNSNQDCITPCPDFLYRGQADRYFRRWPPKAQYGFALHQCELDSIIPADYRGLEDARAAGTASSIPLYSEEAAILRSVLTWGAIVEHGRCQATQFHQTIIQWLDDQTRFAHRFDKVGTIGQHYGLMTGYTDASSSLAVAFWMATRNFKTGAYLPAGHSVVYRWKLTDLKSVFDSVNTTYGKNGREAVRVVDIRDTPPEIGTRPKNQSGWAFINYESDAVQLELIKTNRQVVEAVVFPRTGPCPGNDLTFDFIKPAQENIVSIFDEILQGLLYSQIRQQVLDQWRCDNPNCLPHINLFDSRFRKWVTK